MIEFSSLIICDTKYLFRELGANCLFNERDYNFLKYKYGTLSKDNVSRQCAFDEIFSCYFPNEMVMHNYAFVNERKCDDCTKQEKCKDSYLFDIEKNMKRIVELRNRDELNIAKQELKKLLILFHIWTLKNILMK